MMRMWMRRNVVGRGGRKDDGWKANGTRRAKDRERERDRGTGTKTKSKTGTRARRRRNRGLHGRSDLPPGRGNFPTTKTDVQWVQLKHCCHSQNVLIGKESTRVVKIRREIEPFSPLFGHFLVKYAGTIYKGVASGVERQITNVEFLLTQTFRWPNIELCMWQIFVWSWDALDHLHAKRNATNTRTQWTHDVSEVWSRKEQPYTIKLWGS